MQTVLRRSLLLTAMVIVIPSTAGAQPLQTTSHKFDKHGLKPRVAYQAARLKTFVQQMSDEHGDTAETSANGALDVARNAVRGFFARD